MKKSDGPSMFVRRIAVTILLIISLSGVGARGYAVAEPLKIMTYNVLYGFNKKKSLNEGTAWIKSQNTDVLALQELKGFNQERLEVAAKKWGHDYALIFDRKGGFPQGLTSKTPIELIEQIQPGNDPKLRGTLYCKTSDIHFFVVHFDPRNYLRRQKESAAVADRVKPLLASGEKVVVLGDFNAHSAVDRNFLMGQTDLLEKWRAHEKEKAFYRAFGPDGNIDFTVVQIFLNVGLIDPTTVSKSTFPTRILAPDDSRDEHAAKQQRIDFVLVSTALFKRGVKINYPRDEVLDKISDHYPVVMDLE